MSILKKLRENMSGKAKLELAEKNDLKLDIMPDQSLGQLSVNSSRANISEQKSGSKEINLDVQTIPGSLMSSSSSMNSMMNISMKMALNPDFARIAMRQMRGQNIESPYTRPNNNQRTNPFGKQKQNFGDGNLEPTRTNELVVLSRSVFDPNKKVEDSKININWHKLSTFIDANPDKTMWDKAMLLFAVFPECKTAMEAALAGGKDPVEEINLLFNMGGNGPNKDFEIEAMEKWISKNAVQIPTDTLDFSQAFPDYTPVVRTYQNNHNTFIFVAEKFGSTICKYIYTLPVGRGIYLENKQNRLMIQQEGFVSVQEEVSPVRKMGPADYEELRTERLGGDGRKHEKSFVVDVDVNVAKSEVDDLFDSLLEGSIDEDLLFEKGFTEDDEGNYEINTNNGKLILVNEILSWSYQYYEDDILVRTDNISSLEELENIMDEFGVPPTLNM